MLVLRLPLISAALFASLVGGALFGPVLFSLTACSAVAAEPVRRVNPTPLEGKIMIIYDSSGSMAGEVRAGSGDERKHEVAKREVGRLIDLLGAMDIHVDVGLMAYGHRRRGDCSDIEILSVPASNHDAPHRERLKSLVGGLKTRGKTPIADTILAAAKALKYTEDRVIVVLISDGIEECGGDPCRAAAELEGDAIDFTAHIIGFDLRQQELEALTCVARETGGEVLAAQDDRSLARVVDELAARIAREEWQHQQGRAVFGLAVQGIADSNVAPPAGGLVMIIPTAGGEPPVRAEFLGMEATASLLPGSYRALLQANGLTAQEQAFSVAPAGETRVVFTLRPSRLTLESQLERPELFANAKSAPIDLVIERVQADGRRVRVVGGQNRIEQDVAPGSYRIAANYLGKWREKMILVPFESHEAFQFVFGPAKLELCAINQDGRPITTANLLWRIEPRPASRGRDAPEERTGAPFSATLPPGNYLVTGLYGVGDTNQAVEKEVEIKPEEAAVLTLQVFDPR